ncbi:betaine--homocysteine S-methyltransferase 1-like [Styela clava]
MTAKKGILERLAEGPVIGDGSMIFTLERRGYVKAGPWTPEATVEYPDAVLQLHREFVRAGADVVQTCTFYASDGKLTFAKDKNEITHTSVELNDAACKLARKAADENGCLVCGGISPVPAFAQKKDESIVRREFSKQIEVYRKHDVDFVMCEFFNDIREVEICASEMKKLEKPFALSMRLGVMGDVKGVSVEECARRMAKTGADIIGNNCAYDVNTSLKVIKRVKEALEKEDLHPYLVCQPLGMHCPETEKSPMGYISLPEFPFALDPRVMTRIEVHEFAREAWKLGVRYIGGCCGFEPHLIAAISQELAPERGGKQAPGSDMMQAFGGEFFKKSAVSNIASGKQSSKEYWCGLKAGTGRPYNPPLSQILDNNFQYDKDN